jgi:hypothetical protein
MVSGTPIIAHSHTACLALARKNFLRCEQREIEDNDVFSDAEAAAMLSIECRPQIS